MATYLLTWNPARWQWDDLQECVNNIERKGYHLDSWSSGVTKKIQPGDRVFLIKLGEEPRGIVASGWVTSEVYSGPHWDKTAKGKGALYVDVRFDTILDPDKEIFPRARLDDGIYTKMRWDSQASGITISEDVAARLEIEWAQLLNQPAPLDEGILAEEADTTTTFKEGATKQVTVNVYERSAEARTACIKHYGSSCSVCGFSFEKAYGRIGANYIHVHHLKPLSEIGDDYDLNPITDLRPVCPNCHAMLHRRKPAYTIQELKKLMKQAS